MWTYLWCHIVYHLTRWFPKHSRQGIQLTLILFSCALLVPQINVILRDESQRHCERSLLYYSIAGACITMVMIGFTLVLAVMEPLAWQVKLAFHVYGGGCYIFGLLQFAEVLQASSCKSTIPALYYLSMVFASFSAFAAVIFTILVPFWVFNRLFRHAVLDRKERKGLCYEPVACCSCVWHV
eukprot:scpid78569/ scgid0610/ 